VVKLGLNKHRVLKQRDLGFTLLELLVVITVISTIAAMLLPALSAARRKAHATTCLHNLRQIGEITFMYCHDNNDRVPFAWVDDPNPEVNSFYSLLTPIVLAADFDGYSDFDKAIYTCPTRGKEALVGPNPMKISYGMNAYNSIQFPDPRTVKSTSVIKPAATLLTADISYMYNHPPIKTLGPEQTGYKHDNRAMIGFFDGHISAVSTKQTNNISVRF
jgi:prepilin-type N-terminal cleavage/methylation domain-containing protein/prepilin-type processing-associated H-X9-DG protein